MGKGPSQNQKRNGKRKPQNQSRGKSVQTKSEKNMRRDREIIDTAKREDATDYRMSKINDVSWYQNFPQFSKDVATLPFSTQVGVPMQLSSQVGESAITLKTTVPGVMRIGFFPTVGVSNDNSSPLNRSSLRFYSALRNKQKASAPYDPADAMISMVALDSAYMYWAFLRRAYGVAQLFSPVNRYYPRALLIAMGISTTILDNLAEFRAYINRYAISLGQFATPKFDMLYRHQWMCSGLYADQPTTRAQTYLFVPEGYWIYDNTAQQGTTLNYVMWQDPGATGVTQHNLAEIETFGNNLINALAGDEDIGRITGDIYAAFGSSNTFQAEETSDGYTILPLYNETVLSQIENAKMCNGWATGYTPTITQNPSVNNGAILFQPIVAGAPFKLTGTDANYLDPRMQTDNVLNAHTDSPTPDFVMEATRLIFSGTYNMSNNQSLAHTTITSCGSDICTNMRVIQVNPSTLAFRSLKVNTNAIITDVVTDQQLASVISQISNFDWHPILYVYDDEDPTAGIQNEWLQGFFGDVDNITPLPDNQLAMIHEAAMLSLFDIPLNVIQS